MWDTWWMQQHLCCRLISFSHSLILSLLPDRRERWWCSRSLSVSFAFLVKLFTFSFAEMLVFKFESIIQKRTSLMSERVSEAEMGKEMRVLNTMPMSPPKQNHSNHPARGEHRAEGREREKDLSIYLSFFGPYFEPICVCWINLCFLSSKFFIWSPKCFSPAAKHRGRELRNRYS